MLQEMPVMSSGGGGGDVLIRKVITYASASDQTITVDEMTQVVMVIIKHGASAIFGGYVDENGTFTSLYSNGNYIINSINGNQISYHVYSAAAEEIYIVGY